MNKKRRRKRSGDSTFRKLFRESRLKGEMRIAAHDLAILEPFTASLWIELTEVGDNGRGIYSVALSFSDRDLHHHEHLVIGLLEWLRGPDEGGIFWAEESPKGRPHWHGLVVTRRDPVELQGQWLETSDGASPKVKPITGAEEPWDRTNQKLARNLSRVVKYPSKRPTAARRWSGRGRYPASGRDPWQPPLRPEPARHATRASGFLRWHWAASLGDAAANRREHTWITTCPKCGSPMLSSRRFCSGACRTAASRHLSCLRDFARRESLMNFLTGPPFGRDPWTPCDPHINAWSKRLSVEDKERFLERVAIIAESPHRSQRDAERLAFDELVFRCKVPDPRTWRTWTCPDGWSTSDLEEYWKTRPISNSTRHVA